MAKKLVFVACSAVGYIIGHFFGPGRDSSLCVHHDLLPPLPCLPCSNLRQERRPFAAHRAHRPHPCGLCRLGGAARHGAGTLIPFFSASFVSSFPLSRRLRPTGSSAAERKSRWRNSCPARLCRRFVETEPVPAAAAIASDVPVAALAASVSTPCRRSRNADRISGSSHKRARCSGLGVLHHHGS